MEPGHGNQHASRRRRLIEQLRVVRACLRGGYVNTARWTLAEFWTAYAKAPASTRRRWKCGR